MAESNQSITDNKSVWAVLILPSFQSFLAMGAFKLPFVLYSYEDTWICVHFSH